MSEHTAVSAKIIPFPLRQAAHPPEGGQERLRRALLTLDAAVVAQRDAVAAWRGALADLGTVMSGLGDSVKRYRSSLDRLDGHVANLHAEAVRLERTADAALAVKAD
jgi:hypothetical protein